MPQQLFTVPSNKSPVRVPAFNEIQQNFVNVRDFGLAGRGNDDTSIFQAAINFVEANGPGWLYVPSGTYIVNNLRFNGTCGLWGAGIRNTIFKPSIEGATCLIFYADNPSVNNGLAIYGNFSINCLDNAGVPIPNTTGMITGLAGVAAVSGNSNNSFQNIRILGAGLYGLSIGAATSCKYEKIIIEDCLNYGMYVDNERDFQDNTFILCRFRQNHTGSYLGSGNRNTFINCNWESNKNTGLYLNRRISSGPANSSFISCWFENNGHTPVVDPNLRTAIFFEINPTVQFTNASNLIFQTCNLSSPAGTYDLSADRANNVVFDRCSFSKVVDGGFTSDKFRFSATKAVDILLRQCGELNTLPTPTMYAGFPGLNIDVAESTRGSYGFFYEFYYKGRLYSNRQSFARDGVPDGVLTPAFDQEVYIDTATNPDDRYVAIGSGVNDWIGQLDNRQGSWLPTILGSAIAGTATYGVRKARYFVVGKSVTIYGRLSWSAATGTGNMLIGNLPFTSANNPTSNDPVLILPSSIAYTDMIAGRISSASTIIDIRSHPSGGVPAPIPMQAGGTLDFLATYTRA